MKRFYKTATAQTSDAGFTICLDAKPVQTPAKHILTVPTQKLAVAVVGEWNAQKDEIDKTSMPLTRLSTVAIDIISRYREDILTDMLAYCDTDLTLHLAHETALQIMQQEYFVPVLKWLKNTHGMDVELIEGVMPVEQPKENKAKMLAILETFGTYRLAALSTLTHASGSLYLSLYFMDTGMKVEDMCNASRLEELYQIQKWGETDQHEQKARELRAEITAVHQFLQLLQL